MSVLSPDACHHCHHLHDDCHYLYDHCHYLHDDARREDRGTVTPDEIRRIAMFSVHTSPLEQPGTGDAGGMNVYIAEVA